MSGRALTFELAVPPVDPRTTPNVSGQRSARRAAVLNRSLELGEPKRIRSYAANGRSSGSSSSTVDLSSFGQSRSSWRGAGPPDGPRAGRLFHSFHRACPNLRMRTKASDTRIPVSRLVGSGQESPSWGRLPLGMGIREAGSNEGHMAIQAHAVHARDDRYMYARVGLRAASTFEANPSRRTCTSCGELVEMLREPGGWSVCPLCGRYA
jgi:hypothetical protein